MISLHLFFLGLFSLALLTARMNLWHSSCRTRDPALCLVFTTSKCCIDFPQLQGEWFTLFRI